MQHLTINELMHDSDYLFVLARDMWYYHAAGKMNSVSVQQAVDRLGRCVHTKEELTHLIPPVTMM